jgi:replicative DNA helicase
LESHALTSAIPVEFQSEVLSYLIRDRETMSRFSSVIEPEFFEHPAHRVIYTLARDFYTQYLRSSSRAVLERELGKWLEENSGEQIIPSEMFWREVDKSYKIPLADRDYMLAQIQSYILKSQVQRVGDAANRAVQSTTSGLDDLLSEVNVLLTTISGRTVEHSEFLLADLDKRVRLNPVLDKISTGFKTLDETLGGGLGKGELGIVLAPTGYGKSFFLVALGAAALRVQKKVFHLTLELSRAKVMERYEAIFSRIEKRKLHIFGKSVTKKLQRIRRLIKPADVLVFAYPSRSLSVDELRSVFTQARVGLNFEPDLVIIDYADLFRPVLTYRNEAGWEQLGTIYESLRGFAQEFNIPVWTGSQAVPSSLGAEVITIADIAGSFAKVRIADVVLSLCRTAVEQRANRGRFYIDKNRDGKGNVMVPFKEDFDTSTFWEEGFIASEGDGEGVSEDDLKKDRF